MRMRAIVRNRLITTAVMVLIAAPAVGSAVESSRVSGPICRADGWCWEYPELPFGFTAVGGTSASDVWVANGNVMLHWDGTSWTHSATTPQPVLGIWAQTATDAWAVCDGGRIFRWDGHRWSDFPSPTRETLLRVMGRASDDVWALGFDGLAVHFDGTQWRTVPTLSPEGRRERGIEMLGAWLVGPDEAWIVGFTVWRWDGRELRRVADAPPRAVGIGGRSRDDGWLVTQSGGVWRWDGRTWAPRVPESLRKLSLRAVWGADPSRLWAADSGGQLWRLDAGGWGDVPGMKSSLPVRTWVNGPGDIWIAGDDLFRWNGAEWKAIAPRDRRPVSGVFAIGPDEIWAVGKQGLVLRRDAGTWRAVPFPRPEDLVRVFGSAPDDVWALGRSIWHWDGKAWAESLRDAPCNAIWGIGRDDVWAVGPKVHHWDGHRWSVVAELDQMVGCIGCRPGEFHGVFGFGKNDVWAVGAGPAERSRDSGIVWRWDGTEGSIIHETERALRTIWGTSSKNVWVGGEKGTIRWDGARWLDVPSFRPSNPLDDPFDPIVALWGRGLQDVWAVQPRTGFTPMHAIAWRYDGKTWAGEFPFDDLSDVTGTSARVWVAGQSGGIGIVMSRDRKR